METLITQAARRFGLAVVAIGGIGLSASASAAERLEDLDLDPSLESAIRALATAPAIGPATSFGSPTGFGAEFGDVFAAIGGAETTIPSASDDVDGSAVLGFGLGDATGSIGAEFSLGIISLTEGFGDDGNVNFKLHTRLAGGWGFGVGVENLGAFGVAENLDSSHYAVVSKITALRPDDPSNPLGLVTSIGVGDNRFDDFGQSDLNVFGTVALNFTRQVSGIADWTGRQLNVGASFVPFAELPVNITLGASNITEEGNQDVAFAGSVGLAFNFLR